MGTATKRTVGEVAKLCGVSVRLLHHWDEIGLVRPSARSEAGYRLYAEEEVVRLQRALIYRSTGMPLAEIGEVLNSPANEAEHLNRQLQLLTQSAEELNDKIKIVTSMLEGLMEKNELTAEEKAALMGKSWAPEWEKEAEKRYGNTKDWATNQERFSSMGAEDWQEFGRATADIEGRLAKACASGMNPESQEAAELADEYRLVLSKWHFEITPSKHVILARGYTDDERFAMYYNDQQEGLAAWVRTAIEHNARLYGIDPAQAGWE